MCLIESLFYVSTDLNYRKLALVPNIRRLTNIQPWISPDATETGNRIHLQLVFNPWPRVGWNNVVDGENRFSRNTYLFLSLTCMLCIGRKRVSSWLAKVVLYRTGWCWPHDVVNCFGLTNVFLWLWGYATLPENAEKPSTFGDYPSNIQRSTHEYSSDVQYPTFIQFDRRDRGCCWLR